jgi:Uma2 family endonuclease
VARSALHCNRVLVGIIDPKNGDASHPAAYASAGVKECWLVLGPEKQIEVRRQPQGEQFAEHALHGPGGSLTSAAVPSFTVELDRLFAA